MGKRKTKVIDGQVCEIARWTSHCTGCLESEDGHHIGFYPFDQKAGCSVGSGCPECGYTGKRRREVWVPVAIVDREP